MDLTCLEYFYLRQNILDVSVYCMAISQNTYKSRYKYIIRDTVDTVTILHNDLFSILTYNPDMVLLSNLFYMQKLKVRLVSYIIKISV